MFFATLLADLILMVHFSIVSFAVLGQLAIVIGWPLRWQWIRNPWFRMAHLSLILIVALEAVVQFECPLTTWERELRIYAGQVPPDEVRGPNWEVENAGFIAKTLRSIMMCPADLAPILNACYYTFAGLVLATLILVPPRFRRAPTPDREPAPARG